FAPTDEAPGVKIFHVPGWDYEKLCAVYQEATDYCRENHAPVLVHVDELTQPQGHSTSGSHERYKDKDRLAWEAKYDCLRQFKEYLLNGGHASSEQLSGIEAQAKEINKNARQEAYRRFRKSIREARQQLDQLYQDPIFARTERTQAIRKATSELLNPDFAELVASARRMAFAQRGVEDPAVEQLQSLLNSWLGEGQQRYKSHLFSETDRAALKVPVVPAVYTDGSPELNGYQIINKFFDQALGRHQGLYAFGEDVGQIGGVNQGFSGLQAKYGEHRVFDTGIREWTIIGQAIGMAMRGLRPIAEIQYLDYLIYAMSPLSDDLATLRWRSAGQQMAPAIIRTRGHRLEGIWHSGSPMGLLLSSLRGIYICTPRNMTQAAGMYQTLLQSNDPGLVIECLNGYRLKERLPENLEQFTVPLGVPEVLHEGSDLTLLTYGSCVRIAQEAMELLAADGISVELVDAQTLLPFDLEHRTVASLRKTNRLVVLDEDVPGGANAYLLREVLEVQGGYQYLDSAPMTITAEAHRPAYGSDGDYFSKPNPEMVYEKVLAMMMEAEPERF
ncbi:MAG: transketolase C-terminal domain-containing protein, partial [Bacteroidota bacterium]